MDPFSQYRNIAYPHRFAGTLHVAIIAGGIPSDPNIAEGWLKKKLGKDNERHIQEMTAKVMVERGVGADEAVDVVNSMRSLCGFKKERCSNCQPDGPVCDTTDGHPLYIEGRQLKAAIKEAANVRWPWPQHRWGPNGVRRSKDSVKGDGANKSSPSFFAEHVFVPEDRLYLGVNEPSGVNQGFVHTYKGSAIKYEELVSDAKIDFTVLTDHDFSEKEWALLWLTGEQQGIGASRSQGFGRYEVTRWEPVK